MAEAGGTRKVSGKRIATPFTEPSPGIMPIHRPSVTPMMIIRKLIGCSASRTPLRQMREYVHFRFCLRQAVRSAFVAIPGVTIRR